MTTPLFYIHGGPGFNSFAEKGMLEPLLSARGIDSFFWHEPSPLRPGGTNSAQEPSFSNWIGSLTASFDDFARRHGGRKIHVVALSFGVHGAICLTQKRATQIDRMTLVSSGIDLHNAYKSICKLAVTDFRASEPEKAETIMRMLEETCACFDASMEGAIGIAFQDPLLMTHYWSRPEQLQTWAGYLTSPEAQIDVQSFVGVSRTFNLDHLATFEEPSAAFPVKLLFGKNDPIIDAVSEAKLVRGFFRDVSESVFADAGHFPHLEAPNEFVEICYHTR